MPRKGDSPGAEVGRLHDEYGAGFYRYALMILADAASAEVVVHEVFAKLLSQLPRIQDAQRAAVPIDPFSGGEVRYSKSMDRFVVYSVGPDKEETRWRVDNGSRLATRRDRIRNLTPDVGVAVRIHVKRR